jgi:hypothetical protein
MAAASPPPIEPFSVTVYLPLVVRVLFVDSLIAPGREKEVRRKLDTVGEPPMHAWPSACA